MAKKSIKDNPAFQHLNTTNPVLNIIDVPEEKPKPAKAPATSKETPPAGYKLDPRYVEMRTARMLLVLTPSLLEKIKTSAKQEGISNNELAVRAIEAYISGLEEK